MPSATPFIPRSGLSRAPGTPPTPARQAEVRNVLAGELTAALAESDLSVDVATDEDTMLATGQNRDLDWLCDVAEKAVKQAIRGLSADLIGGVNVTRLDGTLAFNHPRLAYRRALRIVGARGSRLALGDELSPAAQASLVRFCNLLPVQVIMRPGQPRPAGTNAAGSGLSYIVPWGGEALRADLPALGDPGPATCQIHLDRLLRFVLGFEEAREPAG